MIFSVKDATQQAQNMNDHALSKTHSRLKMLLQENIKDRQYNLHLNDLQPD